MGRYVTNAISENDYEKLIKAVRSGYVDNAGVQHKPNNQVATILVLEANLGCRIGDIMNLTTDSFSKDGNIWKLNITEEKTGKTRYFIIPKAVKGFIDKWIKANNIESGKLFSISKPAVWKQLRAVTDYLGIENCSTHSLRKKCATDIYEKSGHDIEAVCSFLQHSDTKITRVYLRRSDSNLEKAISKAVSIV